MLIKEILEPERALHSVKAKSKKRLLEKIAQQFSDANPNLNKNELFDAFIERERLGSTGIGNGVSIPHCRINHCNHTTGMLVLLDNGVDYDAIDGNKVDLVFALIVPEESNQEHLNTLKEIASAFNQESFRDTLRKSRSADELFQAAIEQECNQATG
ncbi:MAG: PTS IIA-like nitrogen regulatory protein PtsN [Gammaproteobacteria bacterium]|nr:PTS IIA-like nitrogen regulatory protein PtsN [Gammaproteobacteria bacterium]